MQIHQIGDDEGRLREWLTEQHDAIKNKHLVALQWIEPNIFGSSIGAADVNIKMRNETVAVELKCFETTKKGIKWAVRPAQRRFHHMSMKNGGRTALLAHVSNRLVLVRGDRIPLRTYVSDPGSGYVNGNVYVNYVSNIADIINYLFNSGTYWTSL